MNSDQCKGLGQKKFIVRVLLQAAAVFFLMNVYMPLAVYPDTEIKQPAAQWKWPDRPAVEKVNGIDGVFGEKHNPRPLETGGSKDTPREGDRPPGKGDAGAKDSEGTETVPVQHLPGVFRGNPQAGKKIALTFDDGPYPVWTAEYLKVLRDCQVRATFFVVGQRVEKFPEAAQKIAASGNEIGGHSYRHGRLKDMTKAQLEEDFQKSSDAIRMVLGLELGLFRPPYGGYNEIVVSTAKDFGLSTVNWNVDPRDWENESGDDICRLVLDHVTGGSVVVLHEGRKSTLKALPQIIAGLRANGYELVTVSELMYNITQNNI